jgi:serine/threonine protein kinase
MHCAHSEGATLSNPHAVLCRYRLAQAVAHQSETAQVVFAEDEDESAECRLVALKLMSDPKAVEREVSQLHRSQSKDTTRHLVRALRFHLAQDDASVVSTSGYSSCVLFPRGDRTLSDAIVHDMFAGRIDDVSAVARIRDVMLQLSAGLLHLHESCGAVHCDFKPLNAMQFGQTWKLIDFDSTVLIGQPAGRKGSTLVAPPELVVFDGTSLVLRDPESDAHLLADPSYDVWSFGVVLYTLVTGHPLFLANCDDNLDAQGMRDLLTWKVDRCQLLLNQHLPQRSSVRAICATELLYWTLQPIAAKRPSMREVRIHPLFQDDLYQLAIPCSRLPFDCVHSRPNFVPAPVILTGPPECASDVQALLTQLQSFCPVLAKHVHVTGSHNNSASGAPYLNGKLGTSAPVPSMVKRGIQPQARVPVNSSKKVELNNKR